MKAYCLFVFLTLSLLTGLSAQTLPTDSISTPNKDSLARIRFQQSISDSLFINFSDSSSNQKVGKKRNPGKAFRFALIPGMGQIYNRKYWKLPLVYGLMGWSVYNLVDHSRLYSLYSGAYTRALADSTSGFVDIQTGETSESARFKRDVSRRNRDYFVIVSAVCYAVQILDAVVDAHLSDFNVNDNLSIHLFKEPPVLMAGETVMMPVSVRWRF